MIQGHRSFVSLLGTRARVLVPVLMGQMARPIISVGDALAAPPGASGTVLALVEIKSGRDNEVFAQDQRRRDMLNWIAGLEYESEVRRRLNVTLRMTANVASSVRDAVVENRTNSVILEWPTITSPRRHGLSDLARQLVFDRGMDLLFVRSHPAAANQAIVPRSILAPIRGGPTAPTVALTAAALADAYGSVLTLLHIQTESQHPDRSRREWKSFEEIVGELNRPGAIVTVRRRKNSATGILEEAAGHDLVIIGSRVDLSNPDLLVGRDLQRMLRHLNSPVIVVRPKGPSIPEAAHAVRGNGHRG